jgi:hypothetical protein
MAPVDAHLAKAVAPLLGEHKTFALPPGALHASLKMSPRPCKTAVLVTSSERRTITLSRLWFEIRYTMNSGTESTPRALFHFAMQPGAGNYADCLDPPSLPAREPDVGNPQVGVSAR